MDALAVRYTEEAALLGPRCSLVAVITSPLCARERAPVIVVLNTGIVHRVGHHRMYVSLSRVLAERGFTVVRFDLSGIGDSPPRGDSLSPLASSMTDIRDALDSLEELLHSQRFVLVGLCAGADHALLYGHTDSRIAGLVLMDPTVPVNLRYHLHYIYRRLRHLRHWRSVLRGAGALLRQLAAQLLQFRAHATDAQVLSLQNLQSSPYLAKCYRASAACGIQMLSVFTSLSARYAYRHQLLDACPELASSGVLQLQFFPASDHLFSLEEERVRLFQLILRWLSTG